ncbi:C-type lectin domain family 2 member B isoform X1 [Anolis carolinensis]|uniref:C-type lectin domain-containing protein n=1 Tax=Anolis carolinensis TaxID=28377 RepID=G1KLF5_ANOCA|nr:PREDICTED: C-type lectin domain family 2 member B isoform X1 [Anolis carolinensis]|eukprot:XP_008103845.1 PREDICTED: C-type lectin domain family 2 member B isoform X1 [Anolis carolinensis]
MISEDEEIAQQKNEVFFHHKARDKTDKQRLFRITLIISATLLSVVYIVAFVITADYLLHAENHNKLGHGCVCPSCPDDWIGYRRKCYYFSLEKRNWTSSQDFCSSQKAFLLIFNDNKEKEFVMQYKGKVPSWIGFRKNPDQIWRWTNNENAIKLGVIGKGGDCAYLNSEGTATASRCGIELRWICSKHDLCNRST